MSFLLRCEIFYALPGVTYAQRLGGIQHIVGLAQIKYQPVDNKGKIALEFAHGKIQS
ncbi:hypothetical protein NX773_18895 [Massilia solisilvae]|uniref:Uncharacterized protein n=1 Tax=Massilia solisilvae TaxID=1811225 RepID=A0ABT2BNZ8_9BURK|nr:hypothetical protein [Massilia solisilvae]MCS0610240.1 hypothetical protein [Massilia solisilvae]